MARVEWWVFLAVLTAAAGLVEAAEPDKILIRNVRLIDRTGQTEDQRVSLLIMETKLHLVTADKIEMEDGLVGYDGQDGVVMGVLDIGQPASFLIFDQDPRGNIEMLLDNGQFAKAGQSGEALRKRRRGLGECVFRHLLRRKRGDGAQEPGHCGRESCCGKSRGEPCHPAARYRAFHHSPASPHHRVQPPYSSADS